MILHEFVLQSLTNIREHMSLHYMYKYTCTCKSFWIYNQQHENEKLLCSSVKTIHTKLAL